MDVDDDDEVARLEAAYLLQRFMGEHGWTERTLTEFTGISPSVLRLYLKGDRMPKPNRDTGHLLAEGFHPDAREELFDAWGYDEYQRLPRRDVTTKQSEELLEVLHRIEAKIDFLIDLEQRPDVLGGEGDPKVRQIRAQRNSDR